jgi:hypothetical protein
MYEQTQRKARQLTKSLKSSEWLSLYAVKRRDMPPGEWASLRGKLGAEGALLRFICDDFLILGRSQAIAENVSLPAPWLTPVRYILAAIFLAFGVGVMHGVYGKRPGIRLNPVVAVVAGDILIVLFLGVGAFCIVDFVLVKLFGMTSIVHEPFLYGKSGPSLRSGFTGTSSV